MGGVVWSIGCINSGNVPLVLNAHIEEGLYKNLFEIYQPSYLCIPVALANTFSSYNVITERYGYILLETNLEELRCMRNCPICYPPLVLRVVLN